MSPGDEDPFALPDEPPAAPPGGPGGGEPIAALVERLLRDKELVDDVAMPGSRLRVHTEIWLNRRDWRFKTRVEARSVDSELEASDPRWPTIVRDRTDEIAGREITDALRLELAHEAAEAHLQRCAEVERERQKLASSKAARWPWQGVVACLAGVIAVVIVVLRVDGCGAGPVRIAEERQGTESMPDTAAPEEPPAVTPPSAEEETPPPAPPAPQPDRTTVPDIEEEDPPQRPVDEDERPQRPSRPDPPPPPVTPVCRGDADVLFAAGNRALAEGRKHQAEDSFAGAAACSADRAAKVAGLYDPALDLPGRSFAPDAWKAFRYYEMAWARGGRESVRQPLQGLRDWAEGRNGYEDLVARIDSLLD